MAHNSFQLFLNQIQASPPPLRSRILQIVFDILMVHPSTFLPSPSASTTATEESTDENTERIIGFLLHILGTDESESGIVPAVIVLGLSKLVLAGNVQDAPNTKEGEGLLSRVMKQLIWAYVNPETSENQELRQCLAYFIPMWCASASANQKKMQSVSFHLNH
jgi:condensin complex subunit 3